MNKLKQLHFIILFFIGSSSFAQVFDGKLTPVITQKQALDIMFNQWRGKVNRDSLCGLYLRAYHQKEYDKVKNSPLGLKALKEKYESCETDLPNNNDYFRTKTIGVRWSRVDTSAGDIFFNKMLDLFTIISGNIYHSKVKYYLKGNICSSIQPIKLTIPKEELKRMVNSKTFKDKSGKQIVDNRLYITYIFRLQQANKSDLDLINQYIVRIEAINIFVSEDLKNIIGQFNLNERRAQVNLDEDVILTEETEIDNSLKVYDSLEVSELPSFENLDKYIAKNLEYPAYEKEAGIKGTVVVAFIIEKNGHISNIDIVKYVSFGLYDESTRVIKMSDTGPRKWKPAKINGAAVRFKVELSFEFPLK
ncbi:MAG: energy transducer TonB [Bacteroidetes bacterium]|nr:energy transducer TonB [Bacteroidota bacterium]